MSIDITLRFDQPAGVLLLLEAVSLQHQEAVDCHSDTGDPADASAIEDYGELKDAVWQCIAEQGFQVTGDPIAGGKVYYKGEEVQWKRTPIVEPVLKGD